jgi:hypothetical protein
LGKMCWTRRKPAALADGGKLCKEQAECLGNCLSQPEGSGKWSIPQCQALGVDPNCAAIYDGGRYHRTGCWVP